MTFLITQLPDDYKAKLYNHELQQMIDMKCTTLESNKSPRVEEEKRSLLADTSLIEEEVTVCSPINAG